jgi:hypothetical protein
MKNDGTYIVEFRTAAGEALAISIPRTEAAVIRHFQERMPYGLFVRTLALYETTCLGALHEQSDEGVVSPLSHSGAQALQFELAPPGC